MDTQRREESTLRAWWRRFSVKESLGRSRPRWKPRRQFAVEGLEDRRLLSSAGSLDTSFNPNVTPGYHLFALPGLSSAFVNATAMTLEDVDNQEKIVLVGYEESDFVAIRFNANGTLDNSFNGDGYLIIPFEDTNGNPVSAEAFAVTIDPTNSDIVVAGSVTDASGNSDFAVACVTNQGHLDETFGGVGDTTQLGTTYFPVGTT